ncbi:MAG: hypothetical protein OdinLCB4_000490 [Candidatus Odinarchaeum yellowstonii]|uniref:Uncharacterized protein n=1 Tax=Odinarchaeota yellowstonii (strain LCB_4) TaxID=1841599 RepID=A0AAF0D2G4_ODILC|nr:MAG: hypothetical protein OdinLCB4_000490 [Candidatus Odinarchaeum yellowstonii]
MSCKRVYCFEVSILLFSILFYLAVLYINPAKVSLNIGWKYLLPSIFGLLVVKAFLISDLIELVKLNLTYKLSKINSNNYYSFYYKDILTVIFIILILLLPLYYAASEDNFYKRYVNVTQYEYDSLRQASLVLKNLKQANESTVLTPFIYQVSIWTDFKFEEYYSFPKNNVTLTTLLNEILFDYIIVSDWWRYHPYDIIQDRSYQLIYSVTDIINKTTRIYKLV